MRKIVVCVKCGEESSHSAFGLCNRCYLRSCGPKKRRLIVCSECGEENPHHGRGLCSTCYRRFWRRENPEKNLMISRRQYRKDPQRMRATRRRYCQRNPEKVREYARRHYQECRDKVIDRVRRWQKAHPKQVVASRRRWCRENPEKMATYRARRAALKFALPRTLTIKQVQQKLSIGHCFYCGKETKVGIDHFVPLSKGGGTTLANSVAACQSCNSSKRNKLPSELLVQLVLI